MADFAIHHPHAAAFGASALAAFRRFGRTVTRILDTFADARDAAFEYDRLSRLSEARLGRMGLRRHDVASHAFRRFNG